MIVSTSSHSILLTPDLDEFVEKTMRNTPDRVSDHILSMDVFMNKESDRHGRAAHQVVVHVILRDRQKLLVQAVADDLAIAVRTAARRAQRVVRNSLRESGHNAQFRVFEHFGDRHPPSAVGA